MEGNISFYNDRESKHIQQYGKNEDTSIKAWKHIAADNSKTAKRIGEFFKQRVDKWSIEKRRNDARKAETPDKCLKILVLIVLLRTKLASQSSPRQSPPSTTPLSSSAIL